MNKYKQLLFFILGIFVNNIFAQEILPLLEEGKTWEYTDNLGVLYVYSIGNDTIINKLTYSKILIENGGEVSYYGACRELGGEVFIRRANSDKDELLYDFSFPERMILDADDETCRSEFLGSVLIEEKMRKVFAHSASWRSKIEYPEDYEREEGDEDYVWMAPLCYSYALEGIGILGMPFRSSSQCDIENLTVKLNGELIFSGKDSADKILAQDMDEYSYTFFSPILEDEKCWYVAELNNSGERILTEYKIDGKTEIYDKECFALYRKEMESATSSSTNKTQYYAALYENDGVINILSEDCTSEYSRTVSDVKVIDLKQGVPSKTKEVIFDFYNKLIHGSYVEENEMQEEDGRVFRQQVIRRDGEDGYVARDYIRESVGGLHFPFRPTLASNADEEKNLPVLLLCQGADGTVYYEADHNSELWQKLMVATSLEGIVKRPENKGKGKYDLQGRRVSKPERGIYIQDGRKVIR